MVPLRDQIQGLTARFREYEDRPPFMTSERQGLSPDRPALPLGLVRVYPRVENQVTKR